MNILLSRRLVTEDVLGIGIRLAMLPVAARLLFNGVTFEFFFLKMRHVTSICFVTCLGSIGCSFLTFIRSSSSNSIFDLSGLLFGLLGKSEDGI